MVVKARRVLMTLTASLLVSTAWGHAGLIFPPSRNANDRSLPAFVGGRSPATPCVCANGVTRNDTDKSASSGSKYGCDLGNKPGGGGQPCLWWSQGCTIGCKKCTGVNAHSFGKSNCGAPVEPTLPKAAWTMNIAAKLEKDPSRAVNDTYRYNPWRRPGSAPVDDACGRAGGTEPDHRGPGDAVYTATPFATMGDLGTAVLKEGPATAHWVAGDSVEVGWAIRYNHGGGYQYRLCPADQPLTEACFQAMPLEFNRTRQQLAWLNGTRWALGDKAVFVDTGTTPSGSTWARNPIPRVNDNNKGEQNAAGCRGPNGASGPGCVQFPPLCPMDHTPEVKLGYHRWEHSTDGSGQGECSGDWTRGMIIDEVIIPKTLKPGKYVLGWRWDCEETTQIWSNCADIVVSAAPTARSTRSIDGAPMFPELDLVGPGFMT